MRWSIAVVLASGLTAVSPANPSRTAQRTTWKARAQQEPPSNPTASPADPAPLALRAIEGPAAASSSDLATLIPALSTIGPSATWSATATPSATPAAHGSLATPPSTVTPDNPVPVSPTPLPAAVTLTPGSFQTPPHDYLSEEFWAWFGQSCIWDDGDNVDDAKLLCSGCLPPAMPLADQMNGSTTLDALSGRLSLVEGCV
eukprot:gene7554-1352_t